MIYIFQKNKQTYNIHAMCTCNISDFNLHQEGYATAIDAILNYYINRLISRSLRRFLEIVLVEMYSISEFK